jgi:hypothetical protein
MSKSQHKLNIDSDGRIYECEMYTTPEEAREYLYSGKYMRFEKDGQDLYVPLTSVLNSDAESTPLLVYKKGDNTKYCIAQKAFYRANVTPTPNAVITAKAYDENGVEISSWNSGAKWFPYGTRITASGVGNPRNIWNDPTIAIDRGHNTDETMKVSNVEVGAATTVSRIMYNFTVNPGGNQTVTIRYTQPGLSQVSVDVGYARTFSVQAGTTWTASITSVTHGYNAGSLNMTSGTITDGSTNIVATAATLMGFVFRLEATSGQTITLYYTQPGYPQVAVASAWYPQNFSVLYGTTWWATLSPSPGYNPGALSASSGTVTGNTTLWASAASAIPLPPDTVVITVETNGNQQILARTRYTVYYTSPAGASETVTQDYITVSSRKIAIKYNTAIEIRADGIYHERDEDMEAYVTLSQDGRYIMYGKPLYWKSSSIASATVISLVASS